MSHQRAAIIRTDAVVLRAIDYGETSRIVTLFTRESGRLGVMARGARATRSRFGSTLEPMSHIQVVVHTRPSRELQTLSEASHVRIRPRLAGSVDRLEPAVRAIELVYALMQSEQSMPPVLDLLVETFDALDAGPERPENVWPWFALHLASLLGLSPRIDREALTAVNTDGAWLQLDTGTVSPDRGTADAVRASRSALRAFGICARAGLDTVLRMRMEPPVRHEVEHLVDTYMRYQVEDAWPERASRVFGRLHGG